MYLSWGATEVSRSGAALWDPSKFGKVKYDEDFDLSSTTNQYRMLAICDELETDANAGFVLDKKVTCWIDDFKTFLTTAPKTNPVATWASTNFLVELKEFLETDKGKSHLNNDLIGFWDDKLHFSMIKALGVGKLRQPYDDMEEALTPWEDYVEKINTASGTGFNNAIWTSEAFTNMKTEKTFVSGALQGVAISIAFAFLVLLISTMNILIALFSAICISIIVACIMAIMYLNGWEFGVAESIAIVVLIGFSVDYVVHLANHYVESAFKSRVMRIGHALKEMGVSILSGAITTLLSGIVLFICTTTLFTKFAIIITCTILLSLTMSLGLFAALCHLIGPTGTQFDFKYWVIRPIKNWIMKLYKKIKESRSVEPKDDAVQDSAKKMSEEGPDSVAQSQH